MTSALLSRLVDTFSPSKLELFERCGEAFAQRYVEGRRSPPRASNALGNAVEIREVAPKRRGAAK